MYKTLMAGLLATALSAAAPAPAEAGLGQSLRDFFSRIGEALSGASASDSFRNEYNRSRSRYGANHPKTQRALLAWDNAVRREAADSQYGPSTSQGDKGERRRWAGQD